MAVIRKRGNSWYLDWRDSRGRHNKSLGKISDELAKVMLKRKEYELSVGVGGQSGDRIAFDKYTRDYLAWFEHQYPSSYSTTEIIVIKSLEPFFGNVLINKISSKDVEVYTRQRNAEGLKPGTVNRKLAVLSAIFTKAKKDGYFVPDFKIDKVPDMESKPPKYYNADELQLIYDHDPVHAHWWKLLVNTGMRLGELHQLKCADIRNGSIYLTSSVDARTKSKKWRLIPLSKGAEKALQVFDLKQEYLLPRYRKDSIKTAFKRACKRAGIAKGKHGVHCLRHTFASNLVMNNVALHTVQKLLGHANIKTTEQYAHLSADYLKDSLDGVDF